MASRSAWVATDQQRREHGRLTKRGGGAHPIGDIAAHGRHRWHKCRTAQRLGVKVLPFTYAMLPTPAAAVSSPMLGTVERKLGQRDRLQCRLTWTPPC